MCENHSVQDITVIFIEELYFICMYMTNDDKASFDVEIVLVWNSILVPIALFSSLSRWGLGMRIEELWRQTPRQNALGMSTNLSFRLCIKIQCKQDEIPYREV